MTRNGWIGTVGGVLTLGLTGCAGVPQADYDAALTESSMLRQQLERAERDLELSQGARSELEGQLADVRSELDRLIESGQTGFEGIDGANVSGRSGAIVVDVAGDVLFASGSIELKNDAKRTLDQIASVISSRYADNTIRIEGHTDSDPIRRSDWETNERLSFERANAVEEYLVSRGVDGSNSYAAAFGPAIPRATKAESRRVEIIILE